MPITQSRMLALLAAARDYQQAWKRAQAYYNTIAQSVADGHTTVQQAWDQTALLLSSTIQLEHPIVTTETLTREITHFKTFERRNIKSAEWQRQKRAGVTTSHQPIHRTTRKELSAIHQPPATAPAQAPTSERTLILTGAPDPDAGLINQELTLGGEDEDAVYIPKELSEAAKANIDREIAVLEEQEALLARLGRKPTSTDG